LLRCHEPYEKPYNDALEYGFLAYKGLFSIIPVVLIYSPRILSYEQKDYFWMIFLGLA